MFLIPDVCIKTGFSCCTFSHVVDCVKRIFRPLKMVMHESSLLKLNFLQALSESSHSCYRNSPATLGSKKVVSY